MPEGPVNQARLAFRRLWGYRALLPGLVSVLESQRGRNGTFYVRLLSQKCNWRSASSGSRAQQ